MEENRIMFNEREKRSFKNNTLDGYVWNKSWQKHVTKEHNTQQKDHSLKTENFFVIVIVLFLDNHLLSSHNVS